MALGLRLDKSPARVFCELSDGELQEGATWEAAMSAAHFHLDGLVALIDCNGIQADGRVVLEMEPIAGKWRAFGFATQEIDGNDMEAVVGALALARRHEGKPHAIVLRTKPGHGVPTLEARERAHFLRVEPGEWDALLYELDAQDPRHD
jgi:transketolase